MIFLRPWWLLALLIPFLFKKISKKKSGHNPWTKVIDKKLLAALTIHKSKNPHKKFLSQWAFIFWSLGILALSGPAWDKLPVPATQTKPNTIIVLDLNNAINIQQTQIKLYDILELLKGDRIGLVLYGTRQGYVAMPLTPDTQLITNLIPSLVPSVLPDEATNAQAGIKKGEDLLNQTGGNGRILFVGQKQKLSSQYPLISFQPDTDSLTELSHTLSKTNSIQNTFGDWSKQTDVWYDRGIWIALLCVIPVLFLFRKNVLFLMFILIFSTTTQAGFLKRADQENYTLQQQGIHAYRTKDYAKAEKLFQQSKSPYNQGNALAYQGKIKEAIEAYQEALDLNPKDEEARFNKEYLEKQLPKDKQTQQQNNSDNNKKSSEGKQTADENQQDESETQQKQDTQEDNQSKSEQSKKENQQAPLEKETNQEQFNQEEQQILNRINKDPARVLRYRINLQHQKGF